MGCWICSWICDRLQCDDRTILWHRVYDWEDTYGLDWEVSDEDEDRRIRANAAKDLIAADPRTALAQLLALADEGSIYAMRCAAWLLGGMRGIARDDAAAEDLLHRAVSGGSWMATLAYARHLRARGDDGWISTLEDGVAKGFVPSMFWLARYRNQDSPTRATARATGPLLDEAAKAGHPGSMLLLGRLMFRGNYGFRLMRRGLRLIISAREAGPPERSSTEHPVRLDLAA